MKLIICCLLFIQSYLFSATTTLNFTEQEKNYLETSSVVRVCVNPTLSPFEFLTFEGDYEGIGADLLRLVAQRTGLKLEIIQTYSWEESIEKARKNKCDILNFIPQTEEFDTWLLFTDPFLSDYNVLLGQSKHSDVSDLKHLSDQALALAENTALFEKLSHNFPNLSIFSRNVPTSNLYVAPSDTIDSAAEMADTFRKQGLLNLKISGILDAFQKVFKIGVINNNILLRDILNKGIRSITVAEKKEIINKYNPIVIDKKIDKKVWYFLVMVALAITIILLWNYILREQVKKAVATNLLNQNIMVQQAKQAELGQLIGNISHQWREPLSNLSGINLMILGLLEHNKRIDRTFLYQKSKEVENTLEFMSQTMQNFLEFYKPSSAQKYFTIYDALQQTLSLVETTILADKIMIDIQGDKEAEYFGIKNEMMQVWLNLINNAIRALQQSTTAHKVISIYIEKETMTFCDNAKGYISQSDLTKGVGLSMCSTILKRYNKKLSFENNENGVCVMIEPLKENMSIF